MNKFIRCILRTSGCEAIPRFNSSYKINVNHIIAVYQDGSEYVAQVQFGARVVEFIIALPSDYIELTKLKEN